MFGTSICEIQDINTLCQYLENYGPLFGYYCSKSDSPDQEDLYHLIVITGVNVTNNVVYTNNPWGVAGCQTFSSFLNSLAQDKEHNHERNFKIKKIFYVRW